MLSEKFKERFEKVLNSIINDEIMLSLSVDELMDKLKSELKISNINSCSREEQETINKYMDTAKKVIDFF